MKIGKYAFMFALSSLVLVSGCGNNKQDSQNQQGSVPGYTYTVASEVYSKDGISIEYPQLSGLNNDAEKSWNALIKDTVLNDVETLAPEDKYEIKYEIKTRNDNFISILASGYSFNEEESYPYNFLYTYNIEIPKGNSRRLDSTGRVHECAEKIFNGQGYSLENDVFEDSFKEFISQNYTSADDIAKVLSDYDFNKGVSDIPQGFSYYDDEKLVVCMQVPHEVGDYVKIIID